MKWIVDDRFYVLLNCFTSLTCFIWTGGTLGRGLNRVMATLLAGGLGFGAHYLASLGGDTGRPIILAFFVFLLGIFLLQPPHIFITV